MRRDNQGKQGRHGEYAFDLRIFELLKEAGLAPTAARLEALRHLHERRNPASVPELVEAFGLSRSRRVTLYRTFRELEGAGLVKRVHFLHEDEDRFELGEAVRPHHHHVVCEGCGTVKPVHAEPRRPRLPRGFKLLGHQLEFYGLCARCARPTAKGAA